MTMPLHLLQEDCWSHIGVSGDRSCPELERHVHCRNCPTYVLAAERSLQRPVEPGYRAEWADRLRVSQETEEIRDASALVFRVGPEWLALPTPVVHSVAPLAPVHRIPHRTARALLGIVNIGGRLAPAVSLAELLGIDERQTPDIRGRHQFARLLVVEAHGQTFALPVAELHGVERYCFDALLSPAASVERREADYFRGVLPLPSMPAGLLDADRLAHHLTSLLR
ncbi:chemotaxis protein CheW [Massilia horti]|uniref:Chemotaxis protein CheW n=1 Tax=Massilia horti TaxID=2562153 RepID=A0A4Y9T489_9BURK|nr:chemotaxis protein CheW [Massilia horti]TFW34999.1 chemotaxis protein CheW [Massilia horti]